MCLTAEALALFLNLLNPELIATEPDRVTIHATERSVHWVRKDDRWCTQAPQQDRTARFG